MREGWYNDDYLALFEDQNDSMRMTEAYGLAHYLPGYTVIGLRGWDDFILADAKGHLFTIPTVPLDAKYLEPFIDSIDPAAIEPDERFHNKVKWHVQPLLFGGDPNAEDNLVWVSYEQHTELVRWWNKHYQDTVDQKQKI